MKATSQKWTELVRCASWKPSSTDTTRVTSKPNKTSPLSAAVSSRRRRETPHAAQHGALQKRRDVLYRYCRNAPADILCRCKIYNLQCGVLNCVRGRFACLCAHPLPLSLCAYVHLVTRDPGSWRLRVSRDIYPTPRDLSLAMRDMRWRSLKRTWWLKVKICKTLNRLSWPFFIHSNERGWVVLNRCFGGGEILKPRVGFGHVELG